MGGSIDSNIMRMGKDAESKKTEIMILPPTLGVALYDLAKSM